MTRTRILAACLPALFVVASGCNVFDSATEATSNDPRLLIADAESAMQGGKPEQAVALLEKAVERSEPASFVRSKAQLRLGTAELKVAGVNVLAFERVVTDLSNRFDGPGAMGKSSAPVCSFPADHVRGDVIDLDAVDGYVELRSKTALLARVRSLVAEALGLPALPPPGFDLNARLNAFRAKGADDALVAEALVNASLSFIGTAYDRIATAGGDEISWVKVTPPGGEAYLGYCAPSQAVLDRVKVETACAMTDLSLSVQMLRARARFYPTGALAHELADKAVEAYGRLETELNGVCTRS